MKLPIEGDYGTLARRWLGWWELMRRWHRYEIEGIERVPTDRAVLIAGYHGRPIAHDLCMFQNALAERLGYLPHPIFHAIFEKSGRMQEAFDQLGFVTGDGPELQAFVDRGEHIIVTPGGTREGARSFRERYVVNWGRRTGYLRLALRYGLDILPVAAVGTDDAFLGLNNGYELGKKLPILGGFPIWAGLGMTGWWPFAMPWPVRIRQLVGEPIDITADGPIDPLDRDILLVWHDRVTHAVQKLMDDARGVSNGGSR